MGRGGTKHESVGASIVVPMYGCVGLIVSQATLFLLTETETENQTEKLGKNLKQLTDNYKDRQEHSCPILAKKA